MPQNIEQIPGQQIVPVAETKSEKTSDIQSRVEELTAMVDHLKQTDPQGKRLSVYQSKLDAEAIKLKAVDGKAANDNVEVKMDQKAESKETPKTSSASEALIAQLPVQRIQKALEAPTFGQPTAVEQALKQKETEAAITGTVKLKIQEKIKDAEFKIRAAERDVAKATREISKMNTELAFRTQGKGFGDQDLVKMSNLAMQTGVVEKQALVTEKNTQIEGLKTEKSPEFILNQLQGELAKPGEQFNPSYVEAVRSVIRQITEAGTNEQPAAMKEAA